MTPAPPEAVAAALTTIETVLGWTSVDPHTVDVLRAHLAAQAEAIDQDIAALALVRAALAAKDAEIARAQAPYLVTCPWCAESQAERTPVMQIMHLVGCGDRQHATLRALLGDRERMGSLVRQATDDAADAINQRPTSNIADWWNTVGAHLAAALLAVLDGREGT